MKIQWWNFPLSLDDESPLLDVDIVHTAVALCVSHYCGVSTCARHSGSFSVHVACLSSHLKVDVLLLFVEGVRLDLDSAVAHNCIFPASFHLASWPITVAALIIGIMLTLVPLCSRNGLTLAAIYADWLDRPGIPKV